MDNHRIKFYLALNAIFASFFSLSATEHKQLPYSNFDKWEDREVKESWIVGGDKKHIFEIGKQPTFEGAMNPKPTDSPWETSAAWAHVSGIDKVSATVFPEKRGSGQCAVLESKLEKIKVAGMINISAMAPGAVYTGVMVEPVTGTDNPMQYMLQGVAWTERIAGIKFDYKAKVGGKRVYVTVGKKKDVEGLNEAEVEVLLQKRWETADGTVHALRIATGYMRINKSTENWINGQELKVTYGDITKEPWFINELRLNTDYYPCMTKNKKGKVVKIVEDGFDGNATPTHLVIRFCSSQGGAFIGADGDKLWIDNVEIIYPE